MEAEAGAPPGLPESNTDVCEAFEHFYFASICVLASVLQEIRQAEERGRDF